MDKVAPLSSVTESSGPSRPRRKYPLIRSSNSSGPSGEVTQEMSVGAKKTLSSRLKVKEAPKLRKLCESSFRFMDSASMDSFEDVDVELSRFEVPGTRCLLI